MTWKAHITDSKPYDLSVRLHVFRRHTDERVDVLMASGWMQTLAQGEAIPDDAGLIIPREALEAIAEAFHPHASKSARLEGVVATLTQSLNVEKDRVDLIIKHALEH